VIVKGDLHVHPPSVGDALAQFRNKFRPDIVDVEAESASQPQQDKALLTNEVTIDPELPTSAPKAQELEEVPLPAEPLSGSVAELLKQTLDKLCEE